MFELSNNEDNFRNPNLFSVSKTNGVTRHLPASSNGTAPRHVHVSSKTSINGSGNMRLPAQGERIINSVWMSLHYSITLIRSKVPHYERHDTEISTHFSPRGQPHVGIIPGAHTSLSDDMNNIHKDAEWFVWGNISSAKTTLYVYKIIKHSICCECFVLPRD